MRVGKTRISYPEISIVSKLNFWEILVFHYLVSD